MRSLPIMKAAFAALAASLLAGCLVSDEPVLDASNGSASPLAEGAYRACEDNDEAGDCTNFAVTRRADGAYALKAQDEEEPAVLRFRRIAAKAYAVQSAEDDGYAYYYGAGDSGAFALTMMSCKDLPEKLRARLLEKGDLATDDSDFEVCTVNTLKGLVEAAKAYHRGKTTGDDDALIALKPAPSAGD